MWAIRSAHRAKGVLGEVSTSASAVAGPSRLIVRYVDPPVRRFRTLRPEISGCAEVKMSRRWASSRSAAPAANTGDYATDSEIEHALLLESAKKKTEEFKEALKEVRAPLSSS